MRHILLTCALLAALVAPASAAVDTSKLQLPGDLTLEQAQKVVDGALAFAKKQGVPMNITVVDAGGNLKAFCRMDGAFLGSIGLNPDDFDLSGLGRTTEYERLMSQFTAAERESIHALEKLGLDTMIIIQVFVACDKNEELARECLQGMK